MATIVEYRDQATPVNEYPLRIVSPSRASACCIKHMEAVGPGRIEGVWRYVYKRCPVCGYTVRHVYGISHAGLAERWARECPDLSHWRVRLRRRQELPAQDRPAQARRRPRCFN